MCTSSKETHSSHTLIEFQSFQGPPNVSKALSMICHSPAAVVDELQMHLWCFVKCTLLAKCMNMRSFFVTRFESESVTVDVPTQGLQ